MPIVIRFTACEVEKKKWKIESSEIELRYSFFVSILHYFLYSGI
jgi:hypothetical protein